jgi:hypothetical protein
MCIFFNFSSFFLNSILNLLWKKFISSHSTFYVEKCRFSVFAMNWEDEYKKSAAVCHPKACSVFFTYLKFIIV